MQNPSGRADLANHHWSRLGHDGRAERAARPASFETGSGPFW